MKTAGHRTVGNTVKLTTTPAVFNNTTATQKVTKNMNNTTKLYQIQKCDFCLSTARYDGKTVTGPWAFMCERHFQMFGYGKTGLGIAQKIIYELED